MPSPGKIIQIWMTSHLEILTVALINRFYADVDTRCQVVRRCDINGNQTAYICPNLTIFNQITLVCHWFWDVDCSKAQQFYDYSNSRLYQGHDVWLLDNEDSYVIAENINALPPVSGHKGKKKGKSRNKAAAE
ncbi:uncharacterized protein LOC129588267 [Paramacrobiotus metropolitanus]|uniref:uncharacterized protein LOC129588267 n=1 Tax=Paramacrobiotus metropolitanus TaxID=2943436 RepID=UPI002445977C|nr:uncharacterized protein LOC129588267 [Paramacrobiotus metropolitanus]